MKLDHVSKLSSLAKFLNLALSIVLVLGVLPASAASAAPQVPSRVNPDCSVTNTIFLPFIARPGQLAQTIATVSNSIANLSRPAAVTARQLNYQVGKTYRHDWKIVVDSRSSGRDREGPLENTGQQKTVMSGVVDVTITGKANDGSINGQVTINSPFICTTDGTTASVLQGTEYTELANALLQPLLFKQTVAGVVTEVSVPQGAPLLAVNLQKGIVNALQATLREENIYSAEEHGAQGRYTVNYVINDVAAGTAITKTYNQDSFAQLISAGEGVATLRQNNTVNLLLNANGVFQSVSFTEDMQSSDESADPPSTGNPGLDGVATWSLLKSTGTLNLRSVTDATPAALASAQSTIYRVADLGAELSEQLPNPKGIDLSKINLANEFARLEAEPTNPEYVLWIADLVFADDSEEQTVITQIQGRIQQHSSHPDIVNAYIDVLTRVGSPKAQEVLSGILGSSNVASAGLAATLSITSTEHALIGLVLLSTPISTSIEAIQRVISDTNSPLRETAVTVLGTVADHLEGPAAAAITQQLLNGLQQATNDDEIILYLDALGNTGDPAALGAIQSYISGTVQVASATQVSDTLGVRVSALTALRKIPGAQAEGVLVSALNKTNKEVENNVDLYMEREMAAAILSGRSGLSDNAVAALNNHSQEVLSLPSGYYTEKWNRHLGGSTVGVDLPGSMEIASPPKYDPTLIVHQSADAKIWSFTKNLLTGELLARGKGNNFRLRAYINIGGGLIKKEYDKTVACSTNKSGNLYKGNVTVFNVTKSIPIYGALTADFNVRGSGYFSLDWSYKHNICSLTSGNFEGKITPSVKARAEASASVNAQLLRGGGTIAADLLNTSMPARGSADYANSRVSFCVNVQAQTQALKGNLTIWADRISVSVSWKGIKRSWSRFLEKEIWKFETPSKTYTLYDRCR
jgi:hypothetical protein